MQEMPSLLWKTKPFHQLNVFELHAIYKLRQEVFVVEQECAYLDADGQDQFAIHVFGVDDDGKVMVYCRVIPPENRMGEAIIGRVATHPSIRHQGIGKQVMQKAFKLIDDQYGKISILIDAQYYLKVFYEELGFIQQGDIFDLDGIAHIRMKKEVNSLVS
jgi:ElaA protein